MHKTDAFFRRELADQLLALEARVPHQEDCGPIGAVRLVGRTVG